MLTLKNFEKQVDIAILQRGKKYFDTGCVVYLEETGDNVWTAEVEGSETYEVEVTLKTDDELSAYTCNCPYNGTCKHVVAVFYSLSQEIKKTGKKVGVTVKKNIIESLLQTLANKDYQNFVRYYSSKSKDFKTEFELFFADKDSRIDVEKKYTELAEKIIRKHTNRGFIDYRSAFALSREIDNLLEKGLTNIGKNNFRDAFILAKVILKTMMTDAIPNCDDSGGALGGSVESTIDLLDKIISADTAATDIKDEVFNFLQTELNDKSYYDYGDFGYNLFSLFQKLAVQLDKAADFLALVDEQIKKSTGKYDDYRREHFQTSRIEFLQQTGKMEDAEKLLEQNIDIVEVRMGMVNKALQKKDFTTAKSLVADGIKIAEAKDHPGTVSQWKKELLRIAIAEKDTGSIRIYTKHFAFDHWFSAEYYQQWKATFSAPEWKVAIEKFISDTIESVTENWKKNKHKQWTPKPYPPLLENLAPVYIQEKYWDRLLLLIQQANDLNTTLNYHQHLVKEYPAALLAIHLPALEEYGLQTNSRDGYADLVIKMQKIIKDIPEGKEKIIAIARRLKEKFSKNPRRPAMIEELNKIL